MKKKLTCFQAFEKGIALFKWPNVYDIWHTYLSKFIQRYKGQKLERTRDLFEQCVEGIPKESAKSVYLMYAKMEEDYGMSRYVSKTSFRRIEFFLRLFF